MVDILEWGEKISKWKMTLWKSRSWNELINWDVDFTAAQQTDSLQCVSINWSSLSTICQLHSHKYKNHTTAAKLIYTWSTIESHRTISKIYLQIIIIIIIMIQQFIRCRNMSMKSVQGCRTPGSRNECRTAPDGCRPLDQATDLSHWPAMSNNFSVILSRLQTYF